MADYDDIPQLEGTAEEHTHTHNGESSSLPSHPVSTEEDPEIAEMKRRVRELEEEEEMINAATAAASNHHHPSSSSSSLSSSNPSSPDVDSRSVYVGNVDYSSTKEELDSLFSACGVVNRVTILTDKFTGHPKGFAYIEFADANSVQHATLLNDTEFKGRQLKVTPKRTNLPAFQLGRGRGRGRGAYSGYVPRGRSSYAPIRSRGYRGRGRGYAPY